MCENCEKNYNHDMRHIMVSIIFPIKNESEFSMKLDKNIRYKNENMNYNLEPKIFSFSQLLFNFCIFCSFILLLFIFWLLILSFDAFPI